MKQLPQPDPRGILAVKELPDALQAAEDATAVADLDRLITRHPGVTWGRFYSPQDGTRLRGFTRPITDAERTILDALGYDAAALTTTLVHHRTPGTRFRWWPTITRKTNDDKENDQ
ncbi:hypothetical protein ACFORJ_07020 [Corynebacterium hansenii]|uniref:Uncharacterized protein n=1 Tax=Corynebacterium hansenii TaxID=394964 RepID=A0ABV7ZS11_9CORY|nr:hypothetical protein [Corynebacterium hansenii]WJZ00498.1 hypothetical protein CHAN_09470 [Corynebacterium hansenii]